MPKYHGKPQNFVWIGNTLCATQMTPNEAYTVSELVEWVGEDNVLDNSKVLPLHGVEK